MDKNLNGNIGHNDVSRVKEMIANVLKKAEGFQRDMQLTGAAALYHLIAYGRPQLMHEFYTGMIKVAPEYAAVIRTDFVNAVIDKFGKGGVRHPDNPTKWQVRPTPFVRFAANIKEGETHFQLISIKGNDSLSPTQIEHIKASRKAIAHNPKGDECLVFPWRTIEQERQDAAEMGATEAAKKAATLLKTLARNAFSNGLSLDNLLSSGRTLGLSSDQLTSVRDNFLSVKPAEYDESELFVTEEKTDTKDETAPAEKTNRRSRAEPAHA